MDNIIRLRKRIILSMIPRTNQIAAVPYEWIIYAYVRTYMYMYMQPLTLHACILLYVRMWLELARHESN